MFEVETRELVQRFLERESRNDLYPERNLLIWADREYTGRSFDSIGLDYDITKGRVGQIYKKVSAKMKKFKEECA